MNITIPEGVTIIEPQAFEMCTSLTTVIIPCNVEYIGFATFGGCQQLSNLTCLAENVPITDEDEDGNSYLFAGTKSAEGTLYVPFESMDAYRAAKEWCTWSNIVGIEHDTDISDIANTIYFENCEAFCGKTIELPIKMKNDIVATGFQFDIVLPEGITAVQDEDGFYDITLSTKRTTAAKTNTFDSSLMSDGSIRVLAASTRNYAFAGNDGEVCVIKLNVSDELPAGDYPIILKNI